MLPMKLGLWQVWERSERVGRDLANRREEEVKGMLMGEGPAGPANPPDLLVISPDGGRLQDRRREAGERWCEYKATVLYRAAREGDERTGLRPDPQPTPHWRYTPSCGRVASGEKAYTDPEPEMKTFTATTNNIERFPDQVELEARRRGIMEADTVAVVGDGGDLVWRTAKEVCEARRARGRRVFEILDGRLDGDGVAIVDLDDRAGGRLAGGDRNARRGQEAGGEHRGGCVAGEHRSTFRAPKKKGSANHEPLPQARLPERTTEANPDGAPKESIQGARPSSGSVVCFRGRSPTAGSSLAGPRAQVRSVCQSRLVNPPSLQPTFGP